MDREKIDSKMRQILEQQLIDTVFQPIASLETGLIIGYEALSRATGFAKEVGIEDLFSWANLNYRLWDLEKICRTRALENGKNKPEGLKLFLNVDANIIYDPNLKAGFTKQILEQYDLSPSEIIIEVTEKSTIADAQAFEKAIIHYKEQNFTIAIDDFGAGYSGINRACAYAPEYIKLDMEMVRNVNKDALKKSAIRGIVQFCKESKIKVIAEGIEYEEELRTLLQLGVDYGQGYFLGRPNSGFCSVSEEFSQIIKNDQKKTRRIKSQESVFGVIGSIAKDGITADFEEKGVQLYYQLQKDENIYQICVLDNNHKVAGVITRSKIFEKYGGQYGFDLHLRKRAQELMNTNFFSVDADATIDEVAAKAMKRDPKHVYDDVVVVKNELYFGSVSVKDLLMASINLQVEKATDASPLTGLPGNVAIQKVLANNLAKKNHFSIAYLDLDSFKAYNDEYGFSAGDCMIRRLAQIIEETTEENSFCGHIGGDDFVIIGNQKDIEEECRLILKQFEICIPSLYREEDLKRGFMLEQGRNGCLMKFELATISIAIVKVIKDLPIELIDLSEEIARVKSLSKQKKGNSLEISIFQNLTNKVR